MIDGSTTSACDMINYNRIPYGVAANKKGPMCIYIMDRGYK